MEKYKQRRKKLAGFIPHSALIVAPYPTAIRNSDVHHLYRQESSIYYFTGFEEEDSLFLFRPGQSPESVLFVRPKDELAELWEGRRYGVEGAKEKFQVDACYSINDLEEKLEELLLPVEKVYYQMNNNPEVDAIVLDSLERGRRSRGRTGLGIAPLYDAKEVIGELRLFKDEEEIKDLSAACAIGCEAHREAMKFVRPGVSERQVEAVLSYIFSSRGSDRQGYSPIVAAGKNGTILHYKENKQKCNDFDLMLIDAGCEYNYYTSDITRTFPVNGTFTSTQKDLYEAVLKSQKEVLNMCKPGVKFNDLTIKARQSLSSSIADLGLIKESADTIYEKNLFQKYFPHGIGHWLGLDVHDVGAYLVDGEHRVLEEGMSFTVEPGLYIPEGDPSVGEEFRGLGVRIEDNILITSNGHKNLTASAPKEVTDIEELMKEESKFVDL